MHRPSSSLSSSSPPPFDAKQRPGSKDPFSSRKQREFIPDAKKDDSYWDRRRRNNEAAKRSREKRRFNDLILERRVIELTKENHVLRLVSLLIVDILGFGFTDIIFTELNWTRSVTNTIFAVRDW